MSDIQERLAKLSPEQRQVLEEKIIESEKYNELKGTRGSNEDPLKSYYRSLQVNSKSAKTYLRMTPLPEKIPGLSWLEMMLKPEKQQENIELILKYQEEMKSVLFRGIDFSSIEKVMDIGCGYSEDLIHLAEEHPHLQLDGYNISPEQVNFGKERIESLGYAQRINIYNRDSAKQPFLDEYDLGYSCQVIHHMKNQENVLLNISKHLRNGGLFVAAEIISNLPLTPIEDTKSTAYFATRSKWAELLAKNNLRVVEGVDASWEMGNFLEDPKFEENFTRLTQDYDETTKEHLKGPDELGQLFNKKLTVYMLITVQKDNLIDKETILRLNQQKLSNLVPYSKIIEVSPDGKMLLLPPVSGEKSTEVTTSSNNFREHLASQEPSQKQEWLESYFQTQVGHILGNTQAKPEVEQPLNMMGIDSLRAVELRNMVEKDLGIDVKISDFMRDISISILVTKVLELLEERELEQKVSLISTDSQEITEDEDIEEITL
ncbi:methyltransferase [Moorena producens JHB]|uniref:Methyltransferase n=2 Tax=Cyanophyceae TaxID=3028117 RepID=A0A1D9G6W9_MOOP1|nr:methyltransferase [Moorena producens]AAS98785.1 JamN [Lyngbya majuscula]AOY83392.1 methyltransferase [Moorena producens JHB]